MFTLILLNFLFKNIKARMPATSPVMKKVIIRFILSGETLNVLLISRRIGLANIIKNDIRNKER
jgi:hypothetical protein